MLNTSIRGPGLHSALPASSSSMAPAVRHTGHTNALYDTYDTRHERIEGGMHSSLGAEGRLLREAQQVQEGDGKGGKRGEKNGSLAWRSAYEDIHLASFEQLRLFWQNVVVDRGRHQGNLHSSGEACGNGKRCVHENTLNVHQHCVHPFDTSAIATATTTAATTTTTTTIDNKHTTTSTNDKHRTIVL